MTQTDTTPPTAEVDALHLSDELAQDGRFLVRDLAAAAGDVTSVLAVLDRRVADIGTQQALRECVGALVVTFAECITEDPGTEMVPVILPNPTEGA